MNNEIFECEDCGTKVSKEESFCPNCHAEFINDNITEETKEKKQINYIKWSIIGVSEIFAIIILLNYDNIYNWCYHQLTMNNEYINYSLFYMLFGHILTLTLFSIFLYFIPYIADEKDRKIREYEAQKAKMICPHCNCTDVNIQFVQQDKNTGCLYILGILILFCIFPVLAFIYLILHSNKKRNKKLYICKNCGSDWE